MQPYGSAAFSRGFYDVGAVFYGKYFANSYINKKEIPHPSGISSQFSSSHFLAFALV